MPKLYLPIRIEWIRIVTMKEKQVNEKTTRRLEEK